MQHFLTDIQSREPNPDTDALNSSENPQQDETVSYVPHLKHPRF